MNANLNAVASLAIQVSLEANIALCVSLVCFYFVFRFPPTAKRCAGDEVVTFLTKMSMVLLKLHRIIEKQLPFHESEYLNPMNLYLLISAKK